MQGAPPELPAGSLLADQGPARRPIGKSDGSEAKAGLEGAEWALPGEFLTQRHGQRNPRVRRVARQANAGVDIESAPGERCVRNAERQTAGVKV